MDDLGGVRLGERLARLEQVVDRGLDRHRPLLAEHGAEIAAVQVLHDQERRARLQLAEVVDAGDVLALEPGRGLPLLEEALHHVVAGQRRGEEELDGDALTEGEVLGRHDDAHAAHPEDALYLVLSSQDVADIYG